MGQNGTPFDLTNRKEGGALTLLEFFGSAPTKLHRSSNCARQASSQETTCCSMNNSHILPWKCRWVGEKSGRRAYAKSFCNNVVQRIRREAAHWCSTTTGGALITGSTLRCFVSLKAKVQRAFIALPPKHITQHCVGTEKSA